MCQALQEQPDLEDLRASHLQGYLVVYKQLAASPSSDTGVFSLLLGQRHPKLCILSPVFSFLPGNGAWLPVASALLRDARDSPSQST